MIRLSVSPTKANGCPVPRDAWGLAGLLGRVPAYLRDVLSSGESVRWMLATLACVALAISAGCGSATVEGGDENVGAADDSSGSGDSDAGDDGTDDDSDASEDDGGDNGSDGSSDDGSDDGSDGGEPGDPPDDDDDEDDEDGPDDPDPMPEPEKSTQFLEKDGYVVMEMESVGLPRGGSNWSFEDGLSGFTGDGYYQFRGNSICNGPPDSPLEFSFTITREARYELRLRAAKLTHCVAWKTPEEHEDDTETTGCNHTEGTCDSLAAPDRNSCPDPTQQCFRQDISNDAFVQILDNNGNYVEFIDQPAKSSGEGVKLFGGNASAWNWTGKKALDPEGSDEKKNAHWDLRPGDYTLVIEGRSQEFRIDRVVLFDVDTGSIGDAVDSPETLND
ncbi:MAG: hypothetical protein AAF605_00105 [Myxococcota bacterium]